MTRVTPGWCHPMRMLGAKGTEAGRDLSLHPPKRSSKSPITTSAAVEIDATQMAVNQDAKTKGMVVDTSAGPLGIRLSQILPPGQPSSSSTATVSVK